MPITNKTICKMYLARSGSNSELSLRANISKKWKSWGFTEYQFLQKNNDTFCLWVKGDLRRTPARSLQTV